MMHLPPPPPPAIIEKPPPQQIIQHVHKYTAPEPIVTHKVVRAPMPKYVPPPPMKYPAPMPTKKYAPPPKMLPSKGKHNLHPVGKTAPMYYDSPIMHGPSFHKAEPITPHYAPMPMKKGYGGHHGYRRLQENNGAQDSGEEDVISEQVGGSDIGSSPNASGENSTRRLGRKHHTPTFVPIAEYTQPIYPGASMFGVPAEGVPLYADHSVHFSDWGPSGVAYNPTGSDTEPEEFYVAAPGPPPSCNGTGCLMGGSIRRLGKKKHNKHAEVTMVAAPVPMKAPAPKPHKMPPPMPHKAPPPKPHKMPPPKPHKMPPPPVEVQYIPLSKEYIPIPPGHPMMPPPQMHKTPPPPQPMHKTPHGHAQMHKQPAPQLQMHTPPVPHHTHEVPAHTHMTPPQPTGGYSNYGPAVPRPVSNHGSKTGPVYSVPMPYQPRAQRPLPKPDKGYVPVCYHKHKGCSGPTGGLVGHK